MNLFELVSKINACGFRVELRAGFSPKNNKLVAFSFDLVNKSNSRYASQLYYSVFSKKLTLQSVSYGGLSGEALAEYAAEVLKGAQVCALFEAAVGSQLSDLITADAVVPAGNVFEFLDPEDF